MCPMLSIKTTHLHCISCLVYVKRDPGHLLRDGCIVRPDVLPRLSNGPGQAGHVAEVGNAGSSGLFVGRHFEGRVGFPASMLDWPSCEAIAVTFRSVCAAEEEARKAKPRSEARELSISKS